MSADDTTQPDASAVPPSRAISPFLRDLTFAYLRAPAGSDHDADLERIHAAVCEEQGFRVAEVLSRPEFRDLEPEGR